MSFKIIMTTSVTRPYFTTKHQTCKTRPRRPSPIFTRAT